MAGQAGILDSPEQRARWEGFQWTDDNARKADEIILGTERDPTLRAVPDAA